MFIGPFAVVQELIERGLQGLEDLFIHRGSNAVRQDRYIGLELLGPDGGKSQAGKNEP
jgi:hypothetical protein